MRGFRVEGLGLQSRLIVSLFTQSRVLWFSRVRSCILDADREAPQIDSKDSISVRDPFYFLGYGLSYI